MARAPPRKAVKEASRHHTPGVRSVGFAILTTTDGRTEKEDESGRVLRDILARSGHRIIHSGLTKNDIPDIQQFLCASLEDEHIEAVITTGGTGIGRRDVTVEAIEGLGGRKLDGFGERFRLISFDQVGVHALMSRSALYVVKGRPIFALPGSTRAVQLATEGIILPLVPHLVDELKRR